MQYKLHAQKYDQEWGVIMYRNYIKRILDFVLAFFGIIILSPIILIVAVLVRIKLGSPVLFRQARPGKEGKIFYMYKFRSMTEKKDTCGELLPDHERLPKFGKMLRSTSLDELPELINILKGDMSVVGPRPLLVEYLPLYNEEQKKRHDTRPGLTGLAQVNGRNAISWEDKFRYDVTYVNDIRFTKDLSIIGKTIAAVFKRSGINASDSVSMEKFKGSMVDQKDQVNR